MAKEKGKKLARQQEGSSCAQELAPLVKNWRDILKTAQTLAADGDSVAREDAECKLCLASRSAYFDLYTWVVIHSDIDAAVESTFHELFQQSVKALRMKKYKESVKTRQKEFDRLRARVKDGESAGSVSSFDPCAK